MWKWLNTNAQVLRMLGALLVLAVSCLISYMSLSQRAYAEGQFVKISDYKDDKADIKADLKEIKGDIKTLLRRR